MGFMMAYRETLVSRVITSDNDTALDVNAIRQLLAEQRVSVAQGAFGTELERRGKAVGLSVCSKSGSLWSGLANIDRRWKRIVRQVHRDYAVAGATLLLANTYINLQRYLNEGVSQAQAEAAIHGAVDAARLVAKEVTGKRILVGASIAPISDFTEPETASHDRAALHAQHLANARVVAAARPDYLQVECVSTWREGEAMIRAAAATGLPVLVSFVPEKTLKDGQHVLGDGTPFVEAIRRTQAILGASLFGLGINCRTADVIDAALPVLVAHAKSEAIAVFPNGAGEACAHGWKHRHDHSSHADAISRWAAAVVEAGKSFVGGGCCGTTPNDIAAVARKDLRASLRPARTATA